MLDQPVYGGHGRHRVLENALPLAENQVEANHYTTAFVNIL